LLRADLPNIVAAGVMLLLAGRISVGKLRFG
jgi:hypothetical protein